MDLKEFIFDDTMILKFFPYISRAPPKKTLDDYVPDKNSVRYMSNEDTAADGDFNQLRPETEADFNQEINW